MGDIIDKVVESMGNLRHSLGRLRFKVSGCPGLKVEGKGSGSLHVGTFIISMGVVVLPSLCNRRPKE